MIRDLLIRLRAPVAALPLDAFRIAVGLLSIGYLVRAAFDVPSFYSREGLVDHALGVEIFWFTAQPIFWPTMGDAAFYAILAAAILLAVGIVLGTAPRVCAALLYVLVVSLIRFSHLISGVDDMLMHLLLFWTMLLPVGTTLTLAGLFGLGREGVWRVWLVAEVPGTTTRLLMGNFALIYLVAGVTKWQSPMWRDGHALYAVLKLPAAWWPDLWTEAHLPVLALLNHAALLTEPFFALLVVLPAFSRLKYGLGLLLVLFHLGIASLLDVAFANLGCLVIAIAVFHEETIGRLRRGTRTAVHRAPVLSGRGTPSEWIGAMALTLLVGAMACVLLQPEWRQPARFAPERRNQSPTVETGGTVQTAFFSALWLMGLGQQYRLLDWIDERNFHLELNVYEQRPGEPASAVPPSKLVPPGMRGALALSYILGGTWQPVPLEQRARLAASHHRRLANRYCARTDGELFVSADARLSRVQPGAPSDVHVEPLLRLHCAEGRTLALQDLQSF